MPGLAPGNSLPDQYQGPLFDLLRLVGKLVVADPDIGSRRLGDVVDPAIPSPGIILGSEDHLSPAIEHLQMEMDNIARGVWAEEMIGAVAVGVEGVGEVN